MKLGTPNLSFSLKYLSALIDHKPQTTPNLQKQTKIHYFIILHIPISTTVITHIALLLGLLKGCD